MTPSHNMPHDIDTIEYRTVDVVCPCCRHALRDMPVPIGSVIMCVCGKCGVRFEFAEATAARRTHDHQAVLDFHRNKRARSGYQSAASHVDSNEFRVRQLARRAQ